MPDPPTMFDIQLLGPPQFRYNGQPLPDPPRRTVTELLIFLLLNRHERLTRDQVAFRMWPDMTEAKARGGLRRQLHNLLQYLPPEQGDVPWIRREGHRLQWNTASDHALDLDRIDSLFDRWRSEAASWPPDREIALLAEAAALWRGDLCAGIDAEWMVDLRAQARGRYAQILDRLGTLYAQCGAFEDALSAAEARIDVDRLGEHAHRLTLWSRYGAGDRMGALRHFDLYQALMRDELGADAAPEMAALHAAILESRPLDEVERLALAGGAAEGPAGSAHLRAWPGDRNSAAAFDPPATLDAPAAPAIARHNLPREFTALVGRVADIDSIMERLERHPLVTITGFGGMGKTRLALAVAHRQLPQQRDGVWWIDLAPLGDPALVVYELAVLFGIRAPSSSAVSEALVTALTQRQMLLVFDNCEHVIDACADLIRQLLRRCPQVKVLATSTERLGIGGEVVWTLPALPFPRLDQDAIQPTSALLDFPAVRLFVDRARDASQNAAFGADDLRTVGEICRRLDGMPLAIELAAARTRVLSVREIAERLGDSLALLSAGSGAGDTRHRALRSAIEWSYQLLSGPGQALLNGLAVFSGGCSFDAIQAMASTPEIDIEGPVLDVLGRLVDRSLVVTETLEPVGTRYRLLDAIRQFGEQILRDLSLYAALKNFHADHYAALAARARQELAGERGARWRAVLDAENDNMRAALAWCLEIGRIDIGLVLGADLWRFWYLRGFLNEGSDWLDRLLVAAKGLPVSPALAEATRGAGALAASRNVGEEARRHYERSLALFQQIRDEAGVAAVLDHLVLLMQSMDEPDAAEAYAEESLRIKRVLGDEPALAVTLCLLANMHSAHGRADAACRLFGESLAIERRIASRPYDLAQTLLGFGGALLRLSQLDEAEAMIEEALILFRDLRDQTNVARCLSDLGSVALARDDFQQACHYYGESLAWARRHGHQELALWQLYNLALAYRDWGKLEAAQRFAKEALDLARSLDDPVRCIRALGLLVDVAIEQADLIAARVYTREMRRIADELEQGYSLGLACAAAGDLAAVERRYADAAGYLLQELAISEESEDAYDLLETLDRWVILLAATGAHDQALRLLAAVNHLRDAHKLGRQPFYARRMAPMMETARAEAGPSLALAAHRQGTGLSLAEAIALVRDAAEQQSAIA